MKGNLKYILIGSFMVLVVSIAGVVITSKSLFADETYAKASNEAKLASLTESTASTKDAKDNMTYKQSTVSVDKNGVTNIDAKITEYGYPEIDVEEGKSVNINFRVDSEDVLNSCNNEIIIEEFNVDETLEVGDNIVTINPTKTGKFDYTCWMGMVESSITVKEANSVTDIGAIPVDLTDGAVETYPVTGNAKGGRAGGCCSF